MPPTRTPSPSSPAAGEYDTYRPTPRRPEGEALTPAGYQSLVVTRYPGELVVLGDPANPIAMFEIAEVGSAGRVRVRTLAPANLKVCRISRTDLADLVAFQGRAKKGGGS